MKNSKYYILNDKQYENIKQFLKNRKASIRFAR